MEAQLDSQARGVIDAIRGDTIDLHIPGTEYRLQLDLAGDTKAASLAVGKRIAGTISASALRMHPARGGGRFIEPVYGHPRIVQGTVEVIDTAGRRVLVDVSVPMWVTLQPNQDTSILQLGELVNFYVRSGATFTPASSRI